MINMTSTKEQPHLFENLKSSSWSQTSASFSFETPLPNRTIHPVVWIKWVVKITGTDFRDFFSSQAVNTTPYDYKVGTQTLAYRQGWCMSRAIDSASIKINDKNTLTHVPRYYLDPLTRLYLTENVCKTNTSGGALDSGSMTYHQNDEDFAFNGANVRQLNTYLGAASSTNVAVQAVPFKIDDGISFNDGLRMRAAKLYSDATYQYNPLAFGRLVNGAVGIRNTLPQEPTIDIYEPLPIMPFAYFSKIGDGENTTYMRKIEINLRLNIDLLAYAFCGYNIDTATQLEIMEAPEAFFKTVPYDPKVTIPRSIPILHTDKVYFDVNRAVDDITYEGVTSWLTYDLAPEIDKVYFYCRRSDVNIEYPTEHFLGIRRLEIQTPNCRLDINERQLFDLWREEAVNSDLTFRDWSRTKSVCVFSRGILRLARRIKVKVYWRNCWKQPATINCDVAAIDLGNVTYEAVMLYGAFDEQFS